MAKKFTDLRVYKPAGEILEFEVGKDTQEGKVSEIKLVNWNKANTSWTPVWVPTVVYESGATAAFKDFAYALREA